MKLVFLILGFFECVCNAWLMRKAFVTPQTEKYTVVLSVLQGYFKHSQENQHLHTVSNIIPAILDWIPNLSYSTGVIDKNLRHTRIPNSISNGLRNFTMYLWLKAERWTKNHVTSVVFVCPQALMKSLQDLSEFSSEPNGLIICSYARGMCYIPLPIFIFVLKQKRSKKFKAVIKKLKFGKFR